MGAHLAGNPLLRRTISVLFSMLYIFHMAKVYKGKWEGEGRGGWGEGEGRKTNSLLWMPFALFSLDTDL